MDNFEAQIILSGAPVPWTPSRVVRGKYAFSPRYREKEHHQWEVRKQYLDFPVADPVIIEIVFYMTIPKNTSKKRRLLMLQGNVPHVSKPDIDNCSKYALDCIKGIVIKDDNQVIALTAKKIYSENPHAEIMIWSLRKFNAYSEYSLS